MRRLLLQAGVSTLSALAVVAAFLLVTRQRAEPEPDTSLFEKVIPEVEIDLMSAERAVASLQRASGVTIRLVRVPEDSNVHPWKTLRLRNVTIRRVLDCIEDECLCHFVRRMEGQAILLGGEEPIEVRAYDLRDLLQSASPEDQSTLRAILDVPDPLWRFHGSDREIFGGWLTARTTESSHAYIRWVLELLRSLR